ncbi:MAG: homogentisate 1,2-dioxygenase, partial [Thermogemmata sp.]
MPYYRTLGKIPKKRHIAHRTQPGFRQEGIFYEEVLTRAGFSRAYTILYHRRPPTRVREVTAAGRCAVERVAEAVLRHHHLRTGQLPRQGDPISGRVPLLTNDDVTLWRCRPALPQAEWFRNAAADEILFVHQGQGMLQSPLGLLPFRDCDYIVIPRGLLWRLDVAHPASLDLLVIESRGLVDFPVRYRNADGQFKLGAPFCERDVHGPEALLDHGEAGAEQATTVLI